MLFALRPFMEHAIDDARFLTPGVPLPESLENHLRVRSSMDGWATGNFVCPSHRVAELAEGAPRPHRPDDFLPVTVIAGPSGSVDEWETTLENDAKTMNAFHGRVGDAAEVVAYDVTPPAGLTVERYLRDLQGFQESDVFVQLGLKDGFEDALAAMADAEWLGAKFVGDGVDIRRLAQFIRSCVDLELAFKAGSLARPFTQGDQVGFLNVFAATALALGEELSVKEIEQVLREARPATLKLDTKGMRWREIEIDSDTVEEARDLFMGFESADVGETLQQLSRVFQP